MVTLTFEEKKLKCQKLLRIEDFGGNPRAKKRETKKGQSPSSSVLDMVNMIFMYIKMKIKEISAGQTYIIVDLGARNFIFTLRLAY